MTEPTQAQMRAALFAYDTTFATSNHDIAMKAAITAAAEVDMADRAGDQQKLFHTERVIAREVAAETERCAQIAQHGGEGMAGHRIAALIRAKKNPPPSSVNMWDDMKP